MSSNYTPWERVQISRSAERPTSLDYISTIFERYMSLHGDRYFGDDKAIVGGLASIGGRPVTVIGQQKGRSTKENIKRNFGMPSPEGYRKSLRLMKQAEKFHRPIINFIDTPGAFPGLEAEEHGQGEAIAYCHRRRRQWWCVGTGCRQQSLDDGKCDLYHSFSGRICIDPLERWQTCT